jgi:predicted RNase H-like HicB family nuclease
MKYIVALKKSKEGYSVSCPGLPGCWSQGKTEEEALENIQDAIREYLQAAVKISKGAKVRKVEVPAYRAEASWHKSPQGCPGFRKGWFQNRQPR